MILLAALLLSVVFLRGGVPRQRIKSSQAYTHYDGYLPHPVPRQHLNSQAYTHYDYGYLPHPAACAWTFRGPSQCKIGPEGDPALCHNCNMTFTDRYPLSAQDLQRAYRPGHPCAVPDSVRHKLASGAQVSITVVGTSMTKGPACASMRKRGHNACAWPHHMQARLRQVWPGANISVLNMGQ